MRQDLTARARIRDEALRLFGQRGYRGTSIRDLAEVAGVSPGLVQHHFGSKAGLREACDTHVLEVLDRTAERKLEREEWDADFIESLYAASRSVMRYMVRGLAEDWPGARRLFDDAVGWYARWFSQHWPDQLPEGSEESEVQGAVLAGMMLGPLVLHEHVARWLGVDPLDPGRYPTVMMAVVDASARMGEYLASPEGRSVREAAAEFEQRVASPAKG